METKREWTTIKEYEEILFDFYNGIARITINRERYRNAFTPTTTTEMSDALYICRERPDINVVVLTGAGDTAFCAGGDMHVKGHGGYIGKDGVAPVKCTRCTKANPLDSKTGDRCRKRFCNRWRACVACGLRPDDCF